MLWRRLWHLYGRSSVLDAGRKLLAHNKVEARETERLLADLKDRLDEKVVDDHVSIGMIVAELCEAWALPLDWTLWEGYGWAEDHAGLAAQAVRWLAERQRRRARTSATFRAVPLPQRGN
jgi:hypothetical protein